MRLVFISLIFVFSVAIVTTIFFSLSANPIIGMLIGICISFAICFPLLKKQESLKHYQWLKNSFIALLISMSLFQIYIVYRIVVQQIKIDFSTHITIVLLGLSLCIIYLLIDRFVKNKLKFTLLEELNSTLAGPPVMLAICISLMLSCLVVLLLHYLAQISETMSYISDKFLDRGIIPPICIFLFIFGLLLLIGKYLILRQGQNNLENNQFIYLRCYYEGKDWEQSENGYNQYLEYLWIETSQFYVIPKYINWAIPILGFIGTVLGISLAAEGIQSIISEQGGLSELSQDLGKAIAPLGVAFDTTLIALSLSLILVFFQVSLQRWDERILGILELKIKSIQLLQPKQLT